MTSDQAFQVWLSQSGLQKAAAAEDALYSAWDAAISWVSNPPAEPEEGPEADAE